MILVTPAGAGEPILGLWNGFGLQRDAGASAVAIQSNGKIVAAGHSNRDFALARYNPDGRLDRQFGGDGRVITNFGSGSSDLATAVAIQRDGKIVVAGYSSRRADFHFALARYRPDGRPDRSFGTDGRVLTDFAAAATPGSYANAVAIQSDGKIVAAGQSFRIGLGLDFALARYNVDGSLDRRFGPDGMVVTDFGSHDSDAASAVAVDPQGRIVAAGESRRAGPGTAFALARYLPDGRLDPGFGTDGTLLTSFGPDSLWNGARAVALQDDGRIVAAGVRQTSPSAAGDFALARYTDDGRLDSSFGIDGKVTAHVGVGHYSAAAGLVVQPDGKIVTAGESSRIDVGLDFALARFNTDGSLDERFGTDGKVVTDFGSDRDGAAAIALQRDGGVIAAGEGRGSFALARYTTDGRLDSSFGRGGMVLTGFAPAGTRVVSLSASSTKRGVVVRWRTAAEVGTRGFNVYRQRGGGRVRANATLLRGKGSASRGASYAFLDRRAPRTTRRYWLQDVKRDGKRFWYGPAAVKR